MRDEHDNNMTSMNIIDVADNNKRSTKARGVDIVRSILTMPRGTNLGKYPPSPWRLAAKFATKRRVYGRVCFKTPADVQVPGTGKSHPGQPKDQVKGKMACLTNTGINIRRPRQGRCLEPFNFRLIPGRSAQSLRTARLPIKSGLFWLAGFTWVGCSLVS